MRVYRNGVGVSKGLLVPVNLRITTMCWGKGVRFVREAAGFREGSGREKHALKASLQLALLNSPGWVGFI